MVKIKWKIFQAFGLLVAVFGVIGYRYLLSPYYIICWIPISVGYSIFFTRFK